MDGAHQLLIGRLAAGKCGELLTATAVGTHKGNAVHWFKDWESIEDSVDNMDC